MYEFRWLKLWRRSAEVRPGCFYRSELGKYLQYRSLNLEQGNKWTTIPTVEKEILDLLEEDGFPAE
jgi:hypothetical protein